jgi:inhibitor of KinA
MPDDSRKSYHELNGQMHIFTKKSLVGKGDTMANVRMLNAGERGLVVEFGSVIDAVINAQVHRLAKILIEEMKESVLEVVPTYRSLFVYFNPLITERQLLIERITDRLSTMQTDSLTESPSRVVTIPVCYGGEFGPDIEFVAQHNKISVHEVIEIHTSTPYLVYMLGFTPGFPYLGGMSERIATPRLDKPRVRIPAGSVGIGGKQTGIYPIDSPGGWQLIGRTPLRVFDPSTANPFLFAAGDYLQFKSIDTEEYRETAGQVEAGRYAPIINNYAQRSS